MTITFFIGLIFGNDRPAMPTFPVISDYGQPFQKPAFMEVVIEMFQVTFNVFAVLLLQFVQFTKYAAKIVRIAFQNPFDLLLR